jgi:small glutamine-rich tetratricopeptide repeat-containing protein alpha
MSAADETQERVPVTDTHRKVVFAFMKMIRYLDVEDQDGIEVVTELLARNFKVDSAGFGGQYDTDVDLAALFKARVEDDSDASFKAFVDLLKKKGYFNGVEEGSEAYDARMTKARAKYNERNNPYAGLSADQLKQKGNELVGQTKYKEAIGCYTRAIELAPSNHILFANRAAAHTHMKDYKSAIIDCEHCIALNDSYAKAYSRLGTALFYDGNYRRAVDAYSKASQLEPEDENHKERLEQAKQKADAMVPATTSAMPPMPGGMPGLPPGMDFSRMSQMMNDPQFMTMAQQMMQNPAFSNMVANMAGQMGGAAPNPAEMNQFMQNMGRREADEDGNMRTPFGVINKSELEKLQEEEVKRNPKFQAIMEDVRANGMGAFQKYMGDPEVMELMGKFQGLMRPSQ